MTKLQIRLIAIRAVPLIWWLIILLGAVYFFIVSIFSYHSIELALRNSIIYIGIAFPIASIVFLLVVGLLLKRGALDIDVDPSLYLVDSILPDAERISAQRAKYRAVRKMVMEIALEDDIKMTKGSGRTKFDERKRRGRELNGLMWRYEEVMSQTDRNLIELNSIFDQKIHAGMRALRRSILSKAMHKSMYNLFILYPISYIILYALHDNLNSLTRFLDIRYHDVGIGIYLLASLASMLLWILCRSVIVNRMMKESVDFNKINAEKERFERALSTEARRSDIEFWRERLGLDMSGFQKKHSGPRSNQASAQSGESGGIGGGILDRAIEIVLGAPDSDLNPAASRSGGTSSRLSPAEQAVRRATREMAEQIGRKQAQEILRDLLGNKKAPDPIQGSESGRKETEKQWYEVLGIPMDSPPEAIRTAYRVKLKEYHPDTVANSGPLIQDLSIKQTIKINEAYAEAKRRRGFS